MRRGFWVGVAGVVSLVLAAPAEAIRPGASKAVAETASGTARAARTVVKDVRGGYVHAISLVCPTAPCEVAIYDSTSTTFGAGTLKWEGRVASNNGTYTQDFPVPLVTDDGIAMDVASPTGVTDLDNTRGFIAFE